VKPIRKILVMIDLDLVTTPLIELAHLTANAFGAQLELIHVFETPGYHGPEVLDLSLDQDAEVSHWRTAKMMIALLRGLAAEGIKARGRMAFGVVEEEVCRLAEQEGFDLIVIGNHSRKGLDRFVNSSVSAALIRASPCPVLVLPHLQDVVPD
jgi:universal stress protein A